MSCITYINNDTSGLQVYISGYTCAGIYSAITLNFGQAVCMDDDYEIIACGNADIGAPCLPPTTPSVTTTRTPTPTPTSILCKSYTATKLSTFLTQDTIFWTDCFGIPQSQVLEEPPLTEPDSVTFCAIEGSLSYNVTQISVVDNGICGTPTPTPTPTNTKTPTQTPSNSPTPSITSSNTPTPTNTSTTTPTQTPTPTECICVEFVNVEVTVAGELTYLDCNGGFQVQNVGIGPEVIGIATCVNKNSLGGEATFTIENIGPCCSVVTPTPTQTQTTTNTPTPTSTSNVTPTTTPTLTPTPSTTPPPPEDCECWEIENTDVIDISIRYYNCQGAEDCVIVDATSSRNLCISAGTDNLIIVSSGTTCAGGAEPSYTWAPLGTTCTGDTECIGLAYYYYNVTQYLNCVQNSAPGAFKMRVPTTMGSTWFCGDDGFQYQFDSNQQQPFSYTVTATSSAISCGSLPC